MRIHLIAVALVLGFATLAPAASASCVGDTLVCAGEEPVDEQVCWETKSSRHCDRETGSTTAADLADGTVRAERRSSETEQNSTYTNPCYGTDGGYEERRRAFDGVIVSTRSPAAQQEASVGSWEGDREYYFNTECLFLPDNGTSSGSGTGVLVTGELVSAWAYYGSEEHHSVTRKRGSTTVDSGCERGLFVGVDAPLVQPVPKLTTFPCGSTIERTLP